MSMSVTKESKVGMTRADSNRKMRQNALREQLSAKGLAQQAIESIDKINALEFSDGDKDKCNFELKKIEAQNNVRFRLLAKVLPDLKQVELKTPKEISTPDISKIQEDLGKIERGETIDSTAVDITDE